MSWSNDEVMEFLNLYRQERIIWDPKHPTHKNRNNLNDAWANIQRSMSIDCSIIDLKRKKESVMSSFRLHCSRKRNDPQYTPSWFAFKLMASFLCDKYGCDSTNDLENEFFENSIEYKIQPESDSDPILCNIKSPEKKTNIGRQPKNKKIKYTGTPRSPAVESEIYSNDSRHKINDSRHNINDSEPNINDGRHNFDEYDLYGQLLAKKLRKLDEHQRDVAMHEIDNIMFRVKMDGPAQTRSYITSSSPIPRKMKSPIFIVTQSNNNQYEDENISYEEHIIETQPSS